MTDVYIAYAREDRESVRILSEMLRFEGWDVWMDPTERTEDTSAALDLKLGSAGAILVVWSGYSRGSEQVRSEAATGLYKNKLIQVRIDHASPPRPFDQVEVVDLGMWSGERDDPNWRRIVSAVRLYAGTPGSARPQVTRRATSSPVYLERGRQVAWIPLIVAGALVVGGAGVYAIDPFGWRSPHTEMAPAENDAIATSEPAADGGAVIETSGGLFEDTEKSAAEWASVDRDSPDGLRDYAKAFPRASSAETARSLLRVMDAQSWVHAVTADNEGGYQAYLKSFPADASMPGAMAAAARERLTSLGAERTQAIEDIQRGLAALKLYKGDVDGKGGDGTARAVKQFATDRKRTYPTLSTAAPRDLRAFAEIVSKAAGTSSSKAPIIATATTAPPASSAAEADRDRIARAQAASQAAAKAATQTATTPAVLADGAGSPAAEQLQQLADSNAWAEADKAGTLAAYQNYVTVHPSGSQIAAAKAAVTRLSRAAPFSLDLVPGDVKAAADAARRAQTSANSRAAQARETAAAADTAPGARAIVAADGDQYQAQISSGAPNGLGVRISAGANAGDKYRGELRNGQSAGLGVYEYADNSRNASSGALRYEGEYSGDAASGYGVTYWKNGDNFAGLGSGPNGVSRGVLTFSNGQRYEGEMRNGTRNGLGVVWGPDGQIMMAGRWVNGELAEAAKPAAQ
jgi:hypothetical protein